MIARNLKKQILQASREYPILAIVGPRQSGKTTLAKSLFPSHKYLSLENPDIRKIAEEDPRSLLEDFGEKLILDEIQRVPELFSYLQEKADSNKKCGKYILTGSHQFLLMQSISQTLAGRVATFRLFPFTLSELIWKKRDNSFEEIIRINYHKRNAVPDIAGLILSGFYPPIHDRKLESRRWIENYIESYIERDVRSLINVSDLRTFGNFLKVCSAHAGNLINYASIANAIGISEPTIKRWISLLETSGIIFILQPWFQNISKRVVKTPKLYFTDTGILCYLLSIRDKESLLTHPSFGSIFENFVIADIYKRFYHTGEIPPIYFYRDKTGLEIDFLVNTGKDLIPFEIKSSSTYSDSFSVSIRKWMVSQKNNISRGYVIYRGKETFHKNKDVVTLPWWSL